MKLFHLWHRTTVSTLLPQSVYCLDQLLPRLFSVYPPKENTKEKGHKPPFCFPSYSINMPVSIRVKFPGLEAGHVANSLGSVAYQLCDILDTVLMYIDSFTMTITQYHTLNVTDIFKAVYNLLVILPLPSNLSSCLCISLSLIYKYILTFFQFPEYAQLILASRYLY